MILRNKHGTEEATLNLIGLTQYLDHDIGTGLTRRNRHSAGVLALSSRSS